MKSNSKRTTALQSATGILTWLQEEGISHIALLSKPQKATQTLETLQNEVSQCTKCAELVSHRSKTVFGAGSRTPQLLFVGEAPGHEEDIQGLPFVGAAGQLLTKMIEAMGYKRNDVYIANVLKCRPPHNRNPLPNEITNCEPFLQAQIALLHPKVICGLGSFAAKTLLKTEAPISRLRGNVHHYQGIPFVPTFHPAYLLRNPSEKRNAWEDLKLVKKLLENNS